MAVSFDLVDLRLMTLVAEHKNLTRSAEAAHLSVPAASMRIKNIEQGEGVTLLHRSSQGVTLTAAGQTFVQQARQILAQVESLHGDLQEYAQGIKGHLRVLASTTAVGEFLPPVLREYLLSHRDVSVDLHERLSHDIVRAVSEGQADVGVIAGDVRTDGLEMIPYREDRLVLVVPEGHEFARRESIAFEDTLQHDHVGLQEASTLHQYLSKMCAGSSRRLKMRIQVGGFEAACRMIEATVGIGVMQETAALRHSRTLKVRIVPLSDEWSLRQLSVCVRSFEGLPRFARDLVELLIEDARSALPPKP